MPIRTCVGCGARKSSDLMVRLCIDESGALVAPKASKGRGTWVCRNSECFRLGTKKGRIERALRVRNVYEVSKQLSSIGEALGYLG